MTLTLCPVCVAADAGAPGCGRGREEAAASAFFVDAAAAAVAAASSPSSPSWLDAAGRLIPRPRDEDDSVVMLSGAEGRVEVK